MSIKFKSITAKNFLSIGAIPQTVNFDNQTLTLIIGENLDLGGDGAKNGVGKTTLLQSLSYALFGSAINSIKRDNLINRTNTKNMMVTVEFSVDDINYRIERGRKPTFLRLYIDNQEQQSDVDSSDSQGDSRETQDHIERILSMSADMFKHIVGLNSYSEPFLSLRANDQRVIIEQLLGITLLSEKAEQLKEMNKKIKDDIQREEYTIRGIEEANKRIGEQIDSLKKRQRLWSLKREEDLVRLFTEYEELSKVDIEQELRSHRELVEYARLRDLKSQRDSLTARQLSWTNSREREIKELQTEISKLNSIDIENELKNHDNLKNYHILIKLKSEQDSEISRLQKEIERETKTIVKLEQEINTLQEHRCYACGQDFHDEQHTRVLDNKSQQLTDSINIKTELETKLSNSRMIDISVIERPVTHYKTESEAIRHSTQILNLQSLIETKLSESDPYQEQIAEIPEIVCGPQPITHYDTEEEAFKHQGRVSNLLEQITRKHEEIDPYCEQIVDMENGGLQTVSFDVINELTRQLQHQEFLLDLLTNKKSFVRRRIIEQNLSYLNNRLTHYLDKMGLPHQVVFQNDLTVEITEHGRDLDFDNCSRGERTRIILGLSFAFRDVWESLYHSANLLFVDELLDNGLDIIGVENAVALLKDMTRRRNKSVWLVSHRDELTNRVESILRVVKENGFTNYESNQ
jgi:DNA repair exonuclease SbcCD ATPase subunit